MALPDIYIRRKRQAEKTEADVYQYTFMSPKLRQQIILVLRKYALPFGAGAIYAPLVEDLREEIGTERLANDYHANEEFDTWFKSEKNVDLLLTAIELSAQSLTIMAERIHEERFGTEYIDNVNARMLEDGFGYQISDYQIIRLDSAFIHAEVVIPALQILGEQKYAAANGEFRQAHKEYVDGNYDDCIHDCCNAFESVLKVILTEKQWTFNETDPAKKLIAVAFDNQLIPSYMASEFTGLRTILESGIPTVRNKDAGHGAGVNPRNIPAHIAGFQLHQTAAAIVLLAEAAK